MFIFINIIIIIILLFLFLGVALLGSDLQIEYWVEELQIWIFFFVAWS